MKTAKPKGGIMTKSDLCGRRIAYIEKGKLPIFVGADFKIGELP